MALLEKYAENILKLVWPIAYILIGLLIYEVLKLIIKKAEKRNFENRHHQKRVKTISGLIINIIKYITIIVVFIAILANFGVNVKSIIAGLGITAALIGLAFQDLAKDLIAGISIIMEDQYEIGDTIEVNGFLGEVVGLGLRTTRVRNLKGQTLIIANHTITEIINYNLADNMAIIDVSVAYEENLEKVEKVLTELSTELKKKYPKIKKNMQILGVEELEASGVVYKVGIPSSTGSYFEMQRILRKEIKLAFDKAKIKIPYQQIEVHNGK
ncbi:MAG: mechanosensitive ion channel family protein [Bacilli bacterium]|nr:mechanosensitive ion channel family protein [Bacilli bacterium]